MDLKRLFRSEELHLAPQLEGLPDEERLLRFQRARRDAFMRRPGLGILLMFTPMLPVIPVLAFGAWLELHYPACPGFLHLLPGALAVWACTRLTDRVRARLIARELERDEPFLV